MIKYGSLIILPIFKFLTISKFFEEVESKFIFEVQLQISKLVYKYIISYDRRKQVYVAVMKTFENRRKI